MSGASDFSLCCGGPLYRLWRRTRLADDELQLVHRRILVFVTIAWVPLLVATILGRHAWGGVELPFLKDFELHARFLVALPLLIVAELVVHRRMRPVVLAFLERRLVPETEEPRFLAAVQSAKRLRDSIGVELGFLAFVYLFGVGVVWRTQVTTIDVRAWHGALVDGVWQPSLAGWWLGCVSLPLFQFLLLRWYYRLFIWARFLWQVSRLQLELMPAHPDRAGGLGFLAAVANTFRPSSWLKGPC